MTENPVRFRDFFKQVSTETKFWKNERHLQKIIHKLPNSWQSLVLELDEKPMTEQEITAFFENFRHREFDRRFRKRGLHIAGNLNKCIEYKVIKKQGDVYVLTEGGKEIAEHFKRVIPIFFKLMFSTRTVSKITIAVHAVLTIVKFAFGFLSGSSGLISDGIDNCVDTAASVGISVGIKRKKERLVSLIIIFLMFVSFAGIVWMGINKLINPSPVGEGSATLVISFLCGLIMLGLSAYQYLAGKRTSNFAFLCQAVDSRNHFFTSLLVCAGIGLSFAADRFNLPLLYYGDAAAAFIIGIIILKSAIELIIEYKKGGEAETSGIKHFVGTSIESSRRKLVCKWLEQNDPQGKHSAEELLNLFRETFVKNTPKILQLADLDFYTVSEEDFRIHLEAFQKKI